MFDGFETATMSVGDNTLFARIGGSGPPLLLIHGYPQNHVCWHKVAPRLAERFRVVVPDVRGYGASSKPHGADYSKRALAAELVTLMRTLGHDSFGVAGHDRGGRIAYRMALDHPVAVSRVALLDIVTTLDTWERMNDRSALFAYHWLFLAQPEPLPETLIAADPRYFVRHTIESWCGTPGAITDEAHLAYADAFDSGTIHASCQDYRAGATADRANDLADRDAGRKITCPVLSLWGDRQGGRDYVSVWRSWADDVSGHGLPCGHFVMEEAPDETAAALASFFS